MGRRSLAARLKTAYHCRVRMTLLALLLAAQAPFIAFPDPGLDDPAAYEGYATRLYRDTRGNAVQIYLDAKSGRVVHLWADALNESIGFTVRADTTTAVGEAAVIFGEGAATVGTTGGRGGGGISEPMLSTSQMPPAVHPVQVL
jgi:hypothetical protein